MKRIREKIYRDDQKLRAFGDEAFSTARQQTDANGTPIPDTHKRTCTSFHTLGPEALRERSSEKRSAGFSPKTKSNLEFLFPFNYLKMKTKQTIK